VTKRPGGIVQRAGGSVEDATLSARIIRADGRVEELGVISRMKRPLWRRLLRKGLP